jgi:hypothetical protein
MCFRERAGHEFRVWSVDLGRLLKCPKGRERWVVARWVWNSECRLGLQINLIIAGRSLPQVTIPRAEHTMRNKGKFKEK